MDMVLSFGLLLALLWGMAVAWFIRRTRLGIALCAHLMWFVVSVGCGVTLLISLFWIEEGGLIAWWKVPAALGVAAMPIAFRSLNEGFVPMLTGIINGLKDPDSQ